jgi:hypothetical protein
MRTPASLSHAIDLRLWSKAVWWMHLENIARRVACRPEPERCKAVEAVYRA